MPRTLDQLFLRASDHLVTTGRRAFLAIVALVLVHLLMVTPWVERDRAQTFASAEEERFAAAGEVHELGASLEAALEDLGTVLLPALSRLADNLESDLDKLAATVRTLAIQSGDAAGNGGDDDGSPLAEKPPAGAAAAFEIEDPELLAALRDALADGSRYGLLAALDPIVERRIVEPRFGELRRAWAEEALPRVAPALDDAARAIPRLRRLLPETGEEWSALEGSVSGLRTTLRGMAFTPPAEPYWWAAPEASAPARGEAFELGLTAAMAERVSRPLLVDELAAAGEQVQKSFRQLGEKLDAVQQQALGSARDRQSRRVELGGLLAGLGLDPHAAAAHFPLILGILLAALILRRSQRLRELGLAARLLLDDVGPGARDSGDLRSWCLAQLSGRTGDGHADGSWLRGALRALGALLLALAWIAAAALQVRGLAGIDERRWLAVSVAGAAAVALATLHRLLVARRFASWLQLGDSRSGEHPFRGPLTAEGPLAGDRPPHGGETVPGDRPAAGEESGRAPGNAAAENRRPGVPGVPGEGGGLHDGTKVIDGHPLRR